MHPRIVFTVTAAALGMAVVLLVLAGLAAPARALEAPDWSQSLIIAHQDPVRTGQSLAFEVFLVNSSTVTAEAVFLYNPIPAHTVYAGLGGPGAFPIVGRPAGQMASAGSRMGAAMRGVGKGYAYDTAAGRPVALAAVDPEEVVAVGWVGDVAPGQANMVVLGVVLTATSINPAQPVISDVAMIYDDGALAAVISTTVQVEIFDHYLPVMMHSYTPPPPPTQIVRIPVDPIADTRNIFTVQADFASAHNPPEVTVVRDWNQSVVVDPHEGASIGQDNYSIVRAYLDILPRYDGDLLTATLVITQRMPGGMPDTWDALPCPVAIHRGTWTTSTSSLATWTAWDPAPVAEVAWPVVAVDTVRRIPLPPALVESGQPLRLVVRHAEDGLDWRALGRSWQGRAFILAELELIVRP